MGERVPRQFLSALCEPARITGAQSTQADTASNVRMVSALDRNNSDQRMPLAPFEHGSGRRELAEAIADQRNPLTPRVWVNRLWQHLFGSGLVLTPSDFGLRAAPPSHPELLDVLAIELQTHAFSTKHIVRQIVSSRAYQQSSKIEDGTGEVLFTKANDLDPDNRWLWRGNPRRLSFEQQRDAWLMAAGQLDLRVGGRARQLFGEGFNSRRTLYGLVDRQFLSGVLRVFDFANPDLHIPQRSETTVPQQALFELNHDFTAAVARQLAALSRRALAPLPSSDGTAAVSTPATTDQQRITTIFRQALGRSPRPQELADALEFVTQAGDAIPKPRDEVRDWQYGFGKFNDQTQTVEGFTPLPHFTAQPGKAVRSGPMINSAGRS